MDKALSPGTNGFLRKLVLETSAVAAAGFLIALAANQLSPRGLVLTENHFPSGHGTNDLAAQLKASGLQLADQKMMVQLFQDPRYQIELVVFIDARDDKHYQEGHIPGAFQLDHYRKVDYLPGVLPVCQTAEQIVVYCSGGDCPDSQSAAITLRDAGISGAKLFVYAGGMSEWVSNRMPVEVGARKSGNLKNP